MKTFNKIFTVVTAVLMSFPFLGSAQDGGTYIDNLGVEDSSYMEIDLLAGTAQSSGSGSATTVIIIVAAVIILAGIFFFLRKKKKK